MESFVVVADSPFVLRLPFPRTLLVCALLATAFLLDRASLGWPVTLVFSPPPIDPAAAGVGAAPQPWPEAGRPGTNWSSLRLRLEATARTDVYPNLFQTSDGPNTLRLELIQPETLALVVTEDHHVRLPFRFTVGTPHRIELEWRRGAWLRLVIDEQPVFESTDAAYTKAALAFDRFTLGTGFARQRNFAGEIRQCRAEISGHAPPGRALQGLLLGLGALVVGLVVWLCAPRAPPGELAPPGALGAMLLAGLGGGCAFATGLPLGKWNLLLVPALALLLPLARLEDLARRNRIAAGCAWAIVGLLPLGLAALAASGAVADVRWNVCLMVALSTVTGYATGRAWSGALLAGAGTLAAAAAASSTPSLAAIAAFGRERPILGSALLAVIFAATGRTLHLFGPCRASPEPRGRWDKVVRAVPYLLFAAWALRHDTLFIPASEMRWEYFVGPIRTVQAGGWLLWDTPSPYGFLSVLLPALLPFGAWQSFYLFHALVLFLGAACCYRLLQIALPRFPLVAAALAGFSFFYADPALLGPAPYPSSSALRFLWVYVLLYGAARTLHAPAGRLSDFVRRYAWAWIAGVLWSGESAAYCTVILWGPVMVHAHWHATTVRERWRLVWRTARVPVAALVAVVGVLAVFYLLRCGHLPRPEMHFMYSFADAGGFGAMPIAPAGPIWIFLGLLAISGAAAAHAGSLGDDANGAGHLAVICGAATLAIGGYFVGQAAGETVTALLPLIVALVSLLAGPARVRAGLPWVQGFAVALVVLGIAGSLFALPQHPPLRLGLIDIAPRLRPAEAELRALLARAGVSRESRVTYYGFAVAMPRLDSGTFESTWLPNPLQLLEEPIAPEVQERILRRFLARHRAAGYIVQARGQCEERFARWQLLLERTHRVTATWESAHYRLLRFEPAGAD